MSMLNLNPRQEAFCQAIFEGRSKKEAAVAAGYSPKSASCLGSELARMPKIRARVEELREADRRAARTRDTVLARLRGTTCDDLQPITICNPNGRPLGLFLPFHTLIETVMNS